jgi:hypothetical protein
MSTYPAPDLLRLWAQGEVTPEQTIGQRSAELTPKPPAKLGRRHPTAGRIGKAVTPDRTTTHDHKTVG